MIVPRGTIIALALTVCLGHHRGMRASLPLPPIDSLPSLRYTSQARAKIDAYLADPTQGIIWPPPIIQAMAKCTNKQIRFVLLVCAGYSQVDAYTQAYDVTTVNRAALSVDASQTLSEPKASLLFNLCKSWVSTQWLADTVQAKDYGMQVLYDLSLSANESIALQAADKILKASGAYINRSEITHIHEAGNSGIESSIGALLGAAMAAAVPSLPGPGPDVIDIQPDRPIGDSISLSIAPSTTE